jgi:hypothetical protein
MLTPPEMPFFPTSPEKHLSSAMAVDIFPDFHYTSPVPLHTTHRYTYNLEQAMNKKFWMAFIAVFVTAVVLDMIVYNLVLGTAFTSLTVWRADMNSLRWIYPVITLVGSFFFTFIFSKGYEGKGIAEGIRYGLYIGIWLSIGMAYGTYAMVAVPYGLTLEWFFLGVVTYVIMGIVASLVYGKPAAKTS